MAAVRPPSRDHRTDWRNLAILTGAVALCLLILSPARDYSVTDDWIYAQAAQHLAVTGAFSVPDWSLASLVALAWWGSLAIRLAGYSLTALSAATLLLAWAGVIFSYGLFRAGGVSAAHALFGAALLGLNPLYLHLSYSFMTDVPYLSLMLGGTLVAAWGIRRDDDRLLASAVLLGTLTALVRQPGILLTLAIGIHLLRNGRLNRRRRGILAAGMLPFALYLGWYLRQPANVATQFVQEVLREQYQDPGRGLANTAVHFVLVLTALGGWMLPLVAVMLRPRLPRLWLVIAALLCILSGVCFAGWLGPGTEMPLDQTGSTLTSGGFLLLDPFHNRIAPILSAPLWLLLSLLMIVSTAWLLALLGHRVVRAAGRGRFRNPHASVLSFIYLAGALQAVAIPSPYATFDRYFLPGLPFVILFALRIWSARPAPIAGRLAVAGLAILALGSLLTQADFADRAAAHATAGNGLLARGIAATAIDGGFEWNGLHHNDALGRPLPDEAPAGSILQPGTLPFLIEEAPVSGYHIVGQVPYFTRLGGMNWRTVLMLARNGPVAAAGSSRWP